MRNLFTIVSLLIINSICFGQTKPSQSYYLPKTFSKTIYWHRADKLRENLLNKDTSENNKQVVAPNFNGGRISEPITFSDYLRIIKKQSDFFTFLAAKNQAILEYKKYFPYLIDFLTDTSYVGLSDADNSLLFKNNSPFLADTLIIKENLQTVSGRAACILNELTGESFAIVQPSTKMAELKKYQLLWVDWIRKLKK